MARSMFLLSGSSWHGHSSSVTKSGIILVKRLLGCAYCLPHCKIPACDSDAYELYPIFRRVYKGSGSPDQTWESSLEKYIADFVETHLAGNTGMLNVKTIDGKIIEVHLRFSPQWSNLYGSWFTSSLVDLYCGKGWTAPLASMSAPVGIVFHFGTLRNMLRPVRLFNVESITMHTPRPSGGFRIAWVNGYDLARCKLARSALQAYLHQLDDAEHGYIRPIRPASS
ncbi:uncharacterized protein P174DRAFT_464271 [Aspergillus novofumigatus IBT 16806]|uniref:Uncharacterized protein n=1 Tax=Aspergillus novofumigatus (strain IBT 16806) TaxID=1392255 RepID=A0A2I1BWV3_ASPN1|nr:uncharacterized protein P174DRAFT_464271 [Aspergillus novofumigatus IBT 16806]PKX89865.1 hypothetical protein P174DRAFT_464271 [Aspergillus novofumigatus IBT 16806]